MDSNDSSVKYGRRRGNRGNNKSKDMWTENYNKSTRELEEVDTTGLEEIKEAKSSNAVFEPLETEKKVANAPNVRLQKMQSLKELDHDIMFQLPTSLNDGVDLSMLTSTLVPQSKTIEEDEAWTFDQLFTSLSSAMRTEEEAKEKKSKASDEKKKQTEMLEKKRKN
ncbi:hypothetical protein AAMO2058_001009000 [Amorphochlora amoebiformis]